MELGLVARGRHKTVQIFQARWKDDSDLFGVFLIKSKLFLLAVKQNRRIIQIQKQNCSREVTLFFL